jgi:hypothetical protein
MDQQEFLPLRMQETDSLMMSSEFWSVDFLHCKKPHSPIRNHALTELGECSKAVLASEIDSVNNSSALKHMALLVCSLELVV